MWVAVYILDVELNMFALHTSHDVFLDAVCLLVAELTDSASLRADFLQAHLREDRGVQRLVWFGLVWSLGWRSPDRPHYSLSSLSLPLPVIFLYPGTSLSVDLTSGLANVRKLCRIFYREIILYTCSSDSLILVIQNCNIEIENCILIFI